MKASFRQCMAWLHTWSGLVIGWLLLAIFATGLASYFKADINAWTRPELHAGGDPIASVVRGLDWILASHPGAAEISVKTPDGRNPVMESYWQTPDGDFEDAYLAAATGEPFTARETLGGELFYRFHFELELPYPWGRYLAGAAAMAMLLALATGIVTHKRIFKDFFTFRPGKGQRSWLDIHNVLGVLSLPFHLMISFTALVTLMTLYMPFAVTANYGDDEDAYYAAFPNALPRVEASGAPAALTPIAPVLQDAARRWGGRVGAVYILMAGDAAARIQVVRDYGAKIAFPPGTLTYDGVTGQLLSVSGESGPALATEETLYGLHMGRFSQPLLRWLYFLSGIGGFGMIATGLVLWTVKRRPPKAEEGIAHRVVERMNVAAIVGVPVAMAAFLWANRLAPLGIEHREELEVDAFLYALLAATMLAQIVPRAMLWRGACALGGAAFLLLPVVNALTTERGLDRSLVDGDIQMALFDLTLAAIGAVFVAACVLVHRTRGRLPIRPGKAALGAV